MPSRSRRVDAAGPGRPGRYGCTTEDEFANNYLRAAGAWMLQYAVLLSLDPETVIWKSMFCASGTLLAYAPAKEENLDISKEHVVISIGLFAALGLAGAHGKLNAWIPVVIYMQGVAMWLSPDRTSVAYTGKEVPSDLGRCVGRLEGAQLITSGTYLASLAAGKTPKTAMGLAAAFAAVHCARTLYDEEQIGYCKLPVAVFAVFFSGVAFAALA